MGVEKVKEAVAKIIQTTRGFPLPLKTESIEFKDYEETDKGYRASGNYKYVAFGNASEKGYFDVRLDKNFNVLMFRMRVEVK
jgi:hypothetical protein